MNSTHAAVSDHKEIDFRRGFVMLTI